MMVRRRYSILGGRVGSNNDDDGHRQVSPFHFIIFNTIANTIGRVNEPTCTSDTSQDHRMLQKQ